VENAKLG